MPSFSLSFFYKYIFTYIVSPTEVPKHELSRAIVNTYANKDGGKLMMPQPYTKNYRQARNAESREIGFPGAKHINQLLTPNDQP